MVTPDHYQSDYANQWCPGCGNFGILAAMQEALAALDIAPHQVLIVSGIGQAAKTPHFLRCNFFHALHGRALPLATGAKVANHELTILVNTGDGDCYGEGGNHFMHAVRRNVDVTVLAHDNRVYGLTKGQASPTSDLGMQTKTQPHGVISKPFNPLGVALSLGCGFVARGFSNDVEHLSALIGAGVRHRGFALIDILQPCVSFNRVNTHQWYKERIEPVGSDHDVMDRHAALKLAEQWGERIPVGILFQHQTPTFSERIDQLNQGPLVHRQYDSSRLTEILRS